MRRSMVIGEKHNYLTVVSSAERRKVGTTTKRFWNCQCDCGNMVQCPTDALRNGNSKSCGKCSNMKRTRKLVQLGKEFGWLTVIGNRKETNRHGQSEVTCRCLCGGLTKVVYSTLMRGERTSCGCSAGLQNKDKHPKEPDPDFLRSCCQCKNKFPATLEHFGPESNHPYGIKYSCRNCDRKKAKIRARKERATIHGNISNRMVNAIYQAIKKRKAGRKWESIVGYTVHDLIAHLEKMFEDGMNWENMGKWHIDHVRPKSWFDLSTDEAVKRCWSLSNLQPMWAAENISKHNKYVGAYRK